MNRKFNSIFLDVLAFGLILSNFSVASARDAEYTGGEEVVYVTPGEPTQLTFPSNIVGGFKGSNSSLSIQRSNNNLVVFGRPDLSNEGEALIIQGEDGRSYAVRVKPAEDKNGIPRDEFVVIIDDRDPPNMAEDTPQDYKQPDGFAPSNTVSGLMRNMVLLAEFGKGGGVKGYKRSNRHTGEVVFDDGNLTAKVDEMLLGSELWGYVLTVENELGTTQRLNPSSFRLDGTRAIVAQRWQLSPKPLTPEQEAAGMHKGKVYIVTKARRK